MRFFQLAFSTLVLMASLSACGLQVRDSGLTGSVDAQKKLTTTLESDVTVRYLEVEGGVFVLSSDSGHDYVPTNLPSEFQQDDIKVHVNMRKLPDQMNIYMSGAMVEIVEISRVGQ